MGGFEEEKRERRRKGERRRRREFRRVPCSVPAKNPVKKSMRPHCIYHHLPAVGRCRTIMNFVIVRCIVHFYSSLRKASLSQPVCVKKH